MSNTTLARDFIAGVQSTLQDNSPAFRRWPEIELVRYINYGQRAIAKYLPQCGARSDTIKLAVGTRQDLTLVTAARIKPADGSAASDTYGLAFMSAVRNMGTDGTTPGRAIRDPVDRYAMDTGNPDWHTDDGDTVVREVIFDKALPLAFYVSPPSLGTSWIEVQWMAEPRRLADGGNPGTEKYVSAGALQSVTLGLADAYVEDLHNYVVAAALLKGSKNTLNASKASVHTSLFVASINAQAAVFSKVSPNLKSLPFLHEIPAAT